MAGDNALFLLLHLLSVVVTQYGRLDVVAFPFIGGTVPEGHQGQSIQGVNDQMGIDVHAFFRPDIFPLFVVTSTSGMSHAAILSRLKTGFHRLRIPWGHNAEHQPVGGKFTSREHALTAGCVLASYVPNPTHILQRQFCFYDVI